MRNLLLVRYGEIFLKGQNRPLFMRALVKRSKYAVKDLGATVLLHDGRILVADFDYLDEGIRREPMVFGVHSVCPAVAASPFTVRSAFCPTVFRRPVWARAMNS